MGVLTHGNVRVTLPLPAVAPGLADDVAAFAPRSRRRSGAVARPSSGSATCERRPATSRRASVDARGERCPLPVIRLARAVRDGPGLRVVTVLATDPAAAHDVPAWCRMRGHRFVEARAEADHTAYVVEVVRPSSAGEAGALSDRRQDREVLVARDLAHAEAWPGGRRLPLDVDEPTRVAVGDEQVAQADEGDLRGVADVVEHRLAGEEAADRDAVEAADERAVLPGLDGVRPPGRAARRRRRRSRG